MTKTKTYTNTDAAILAAIRAGNVRPRFIVPLVRETIEAETGVVGTHNGYEIERVVDRRLQAMKRAGLLSFTTPRGWKVKP